MTPQCPTQWTFGCRAIQRWDDGRCASRQTHHSDFIVTDPWGPRRLDSTLLHPLPSDLTGDGCLGCQTTVLGTINNRCRFWRLTRISCPKGRRMWYIQIECEVLCNLLRLQVIGERPYLHKEGIIWLLCPFRTFCFTGYLPSFTNKVINSLLTSVYDGSTGSFIYDRIKWPWAMALVQQVP